MSHPEKRVERGRGAPLSVLLIPPQHLDQIRHVEPEEREEGEHKDEVEDHGARGVVVAGLVQQSQARAAACI